MACHHLLTAFSRTCTGSVISPATSQPWQPLDTFPLHQIKRPFYTICIDNYVYMRFLWLAGLEKGVTGVSTCQCVKTGIRQKMLSKQKCSKVPTDGVRCVHKFAFQ